MNKSENNFPYNSNTEKLLLITGLLGIILPFVLFCVTAFFAMKLAFTWIAIHGYSEVPAWIIYLGLSPWLFSPALNIFGIIIGVVKKRERHSLLCLILSIVGLMINIGTVLVVWYLGSTF